MTLALRREFAGVDISGGAQGSNAGTELGQKVVD